ncbi:MAG: hypothetical protein WAU07_01255 [Microgenomates group bacterium]
MQQYDKQTYALTHGDIEPSQDRDSVIRELQMQDQAGRSTKFNRTLLQYLLIHTDISLADAWDDVEGHFAQEARTRPRKNPYR